MSHLIITGGHVIDPSQSFDAPMDVEIEDGKIKQITKKNLSKAGDNIIDAKGLIVAPGLIDLHCYLREPGYEYKETIETGTKAAAKGGYTTICCMPKTLPINDQAAITDYIIQQGKVKGHVKLHPIGALTESIKSAQLATIGELKEAGCIALANAGQSVRNSNVMRMALEYAHGFDLLVMTFCLDTDLSADGVMNEGPLSTKLGLKGIPSEAESIMIARDLYLANLTGARLHVTNVTTKESVRLIAQAKKQGLNVTADVTPHHLLLTDSAVGFYNTNAKVMPPLRGEEDRKALIQGLIDGTIDAITTDHAPHAPIDKEREFDEASPGVCGFETALGILGASADKIGFSWKMLIEKMSTNPARILGLKEGALKEGNWADLMIIDPKRKSKVDSSTFISKGRNTPFDGHEMVGQVSHTIVNGKIVYKGEEKKNG